MHIFFSYSSGGDESKIKVLVGLHSFWRLQGGISFLDSLVSRSHLHSLAHGPFIISIQPLVSNILSPITDSDLLVFLL